MNEDIHIQLSSRHIAFIVGTLVGFLFWGAQQAFGATFETGIAPLDHVVTATQSATSTLLATPSATTTLTATPTAATPLPAPSPIQTKKVNLSRHGFKVGLQVGHLDNQYPPAELRFISRNTGASGAGTTEPAVAQRIALLTKSMLEEHGVEVEILPAVVAPNYQADAFISIHTDGSEKPHISGYKTAASAYDQSGNAPLLSSLIDAEYGKTTQLRKDEKITENMTHYYSFANGRIDHSISPYTPGVLLETGFLTSETDQTVIVNQPEKSARGLANGIVAYLQTQT